MKEIQLSQQLTAVVDDEDYAELMKHRWCVRRGNGGFWVAIRNSNGYDPKEGPRQYQMHREIMKAPRGVEVDHINGDTLDNRRANLRLATRSQNLANRRAFSNTGYKGVTRYKNDPTRFTLQFAKVYTSAEEAAQMYDKITRLVNGEFARVNFPESV